LKFHLKEVHNVINEEALKVLVTTTYLNKKKDNDQIKDEMNENNHLMRSINSNNNG
jgi:hypothetical protein